MKGTDICTEMDGIIKNKWNEVIIKNGTFLIRGRTFNKWGVSEAYQWMEKGGSRSGSVQDIITKVLTDPVGG